MEEKRKEGFDIQKSFLGKASLIFLCRYYYTRYLLVSLTCSFSFFFYSNAQTANNTTLQIEERNVY